MTKKSASQFKVVKDQQPKQKQDPEEMFAEYLKVEKELVETQCKIVKRVDSYVDVKREAEEFFGDRATVTITDVKNYVKVLAGAFDEVREIVDGYGYEWASAPEYEDPFEESLALYEEPKTMEDLFRQHLRFKAIRPYGDRALKLYCMVQESLPRE